MISPLSSASSPPIMFSRVVLPEPDGPDRQMNEPCSMSSVT